MKDRLRKEYKERRKHIDFNRESLKIFNQLIKGFELSHKTISVFIPISKFNEVDTWPIIRYAIENHCSICTTRSNFQDKSMDHILFENKDQLKENNWGILEPDKGEIIPVSKIDIVIIPLLAFDLEGNRVGYGGGFYDRFLSECRKNALKIGLSYFDAESTLIESNEYDVPLDYCVTPEKVYEF